METLLNNLESFLTFWQILIAGPISILLPSLPLFFVFIFVFSVFSRLPIDVPSLISIALGGTFAFLVVFLLPAVVFDINFSQGTIYVLLSALYLSALRIFPWRRVLPETNALPGYMIIALLIVVTRLLFLNDLYFPLNTDSAIHYQLISKLIDSTSSPFSFSSLQTFLRDYYHLGFHSLVAFEHTITGIAINQLMLVVGQFLQVLIPITFYPIGRWTTRSPWGGYIAMTVAAFGWSMPLHASNWGKYPALLALLIFLLFIALSCWARAHSKSLFASQKHLLLLIYGSILISGSFAHSRFPFLLVGFLLAITICEKKWKGIVRQRKIYALAALLVGELLVLWFYSLQDFQHTINMYAGAGFYSLLMIFCFFPYIQSTFKSVALEQLWYVIILLGFLFLPVPFTSSLENSLLNPNFTGPFNFSQLIDRPLFEMTVFIPLTILLTLGLVGWLRTLSSRTSVRAMNCIKAIALIILVIFGLINFPMTPVCCQLLFLDDLFAMQWMENELPKTSTILISGAYSPDRRYFQTTDAGIWIQPLTKLTTVDWSYDDAFDDNSLHALCAGMVTHIYAGSDSFSFSKHQIQRSTDIVKRYGQGNVSIFEVMCQSTHE